MAVGFQYRLPPIHVRRVDHHLPVKAAGPQQGLIQDLGAVGGGRRGGRNRPDLSQCLSQSLG